MVSTLHRELTHALEAAGIPDAAFDVRCMTEQVCGRPGQLSPEEEQQIRAMAARRMTGEPLQYILGEWEFYGRRFFVGKGVLIPRPDTETLVDAVLTRCRQNPQAHWQIADLCSGSGCIAITLGKELPHADVLAVEWSSCAIGYLMNNAAFHRLPVEIHHADVCSPPSARAVRGLDIIVSNPPYLTQRDMDNLQREVQHEPAMALTGGADGLHFYREITSLWKDSLRPGGLLAYEVGMGQADAVRTIMEEHQFTDLEITCDLAGIARVVTGIRT